jgi:hypothetical protein
MSIQMSFDFDSIDAPQWVDLRQPEDYTLDDSWFEGPLKEVFE